MDKGTTTEKKDYYFQTLTFKQSDQNFTDRNESNKQSIAVSQEVKDNTPKKKNTDGDESLSESPHFNRYTMIKDNINNQDTALNVETNSQKASGRNSHKKQPKSNQSEPEWLRMKRTNVEIFKKIGEQNQSKQKNYVKEQNKDQEKNVNISNEQQQIAVIKGPISQKFQSEQARSFDDAMNLEAQQQFYMQLMNSNPISPKQGSEVEPLINLITLGQETESLKNKSSRKMFLTQDGMVSPLGQMITKEQLKNLVIVSDSSQITPKLSTERLALNKSIKIMSRNITSTEKKQSPRGGTWEGSFDKTQYLPLVNEVEENETTKEQQVRKNVQGVKSGDTERLSQRDVSGQIISVQVFTEESVIVDSQINLQNDYTDVLSDDIKPLNSLNHLDILKTQIDIKLKHQNDDNSLNIAQSSQSNRCGSFDKRYQNVFKLDKTMSPSAQSSHYDKKDRFGNETQHISLIEIQSKKQNEIINNLQKYQSNLKNIPDQSSLEFGITGIGQNRIFNQYETIQLRTSQLDSLQISVLNQKYSNNSPQKSSEKTSNQIRLRNVGFPQKFNDSLNKDSTPQPEYSLTNFVDTQKQSQVDELNIQKVDSNQQTEENKITLITQRFQTAPSNLRQNIPSQADKRGKTPQLQANQLLTQYMMEKGLPLFGAHMGKFQNLGSQWPNNLTPRSATADNVMKPAWREVIRTNRLLKQNIPWEAIAHQVSDIQQYNQEISNNKQIFKILSEQEKLSLKSKKGTIEYEGIVSIAENGSLRVRNDFVNKHQNPFKTNEFLKHLGSPRLNQKAGNGVFKARRQTMNQKNNVKQELPANLQNVDLEYKVIRERLNTCSTQESKQILGLQPDIIYSQGMAENQYQKEMSINNKIKSYDVIEQMIKQQLENHQNEFSLLKGKANRKILIKLQQNQNRLKKLLESNQESQINTNMVTSMNTPMVSFGKDCFNEFNELNFRGTPQESANKNSSNYERKNSQIERMSQLSKINESVIVGAQIIDTRNHSKQNTQDTKQNTQFSNQNSFDNDKNDGLQSHEQRIAQPLELNLDNKVFGIRVKSQGSKQGPSPRNLYRKMKVPGSRPTTLQLDEQKNSQRSQDSQKSVNTHDHENILQETHKMASRLETILSSRNKTQTGNKLKDPKEAEFDNFRNTQTFQARVLSQPVNKVYQTNNLSFRNNDNQEMLSASFKKLFNQIDEGSNGDELNKLANQNFQAIIESQKAVYEQAIQQKKEQIKNTSPSLAKANYKSGNGRVHGIRGNPFKEQTVGKTKDGRMFTQSILRPIVQEEIRQFSIVDKTKPIFKNFEINGQANIGTKKKKINKQKRVQKKEDDFSGDFVVNPANKNIRIRVHSTLVSNEKMKQIRVNTPKNDTPLARFPTPLGTPLSRLQTQYVEHLTLPNSSVLSRTIQDRSRQVTLKLESTDQSKRRQTYSKLSNLRKVVNLGDEISQAQDHIVHEVMENSSSEQLPNVHKMEQQETLKLVRTANEAQDYKVMRGILKSQDGHRTNKYTLQLNSLQSIPSLNEDKQALSPLFSLVGQKPFQGLRLEPMMRIQHQRFGTSSNILSPKVPSTITAQRKSSENLSIIEIDNNGHNKPETESITQPGHLSPKQYDQTDTKSYGNSKILLTIGSNRLLTTPKYDQFNQDQDVVELKSNIRIV